MVKLLISGSQSWLLLSLLVFSQSIAGSVWLKPGKTEVGSHRWLRNVGGAERIFFVSSFLEVKLGDDDRLKVGIEQQIQDPSNPFDQIYSNQKYQWTENRFEFQAMRQFHRLDKVDFMGFFKGGVQPYLQWFAGFDAPQQLELPYEGIFPAEALFILPRVLVASGKTEFQGHLLNTMGIPQNTTNTPLYFRLTVEEAFFKIMDVDTRRVRLDIDGKAGFFYITTSGNYLLMKGILPDRSKIELLLPNHSSVLF